MERLTPTPGLLDGKAVVVGVCGGIAAYKAAAIVSAMAQSGAAVTVCMTEAATKFVTPLTFQALSARPVYTSAWQHAESHDPQHISTASKADAVVIAPCTMNAMARIASGRTDDIVSLILSAVDRTTTPVLLAPAMNAVMWDQPATRRNAEILRGDGFGFVGPNDGWQACRAVGAGRMAEPGEIFQAVVGAVDATAQARTIKTG